MSSRFERSSLTANDDFFDGTDVAHPAYWRGYEAAVSDIARQINAMLHTDAPTVPNRTKQEKLSANAAWMRVRSQLEKLVDAQRNLDRVDRVSRFDVDGI